MFHLFRILHVFRDSVSSIYEDTVDRNSAKEGCKKGISASSNIYTKMSHHFHVLVVYCLMIIYQETRNQNLLLTLILTTCNIHELGKTCVPFLKIFNDTL